jgi:hypothetical protein
VSVLTVFGVLSTVGIGLLVRRIPMLSRLVLAGEDAFVTFNVYGLAFSLVASASTVMRRRDTAILILAATVIWGIFVARGLASEMIRFILFASLITIGVRMGISPNGRSSGGALVGRSTIIGGSFCAAGGMGYYWVGGLLGAPDSAVAGGVLVGLLWGFSLGVAVSLGVSFGNGVVNWITPKVK